MLTFVCIFEYTDTDVSISWLPKTAAEVVAKVSLHAVLRCESVRGDRNRKALYKCWQWFLKAYALFNFPWSLAASTVKLAFKRFPEFVKVSIIWRACLVPRARFYLKPYWVT